MSDNVLIENPSMRKVMKELKTNKSEENTNLFYEEVVMNTQFL